MKYEQTVQVELKEYICMVKRIDGVVAQKTLEQELIRCKDCKWYDMTDSSGTVEPIGYRCKKVNRLWREPDDFCKGAERKDGYVTLHHDDIHFIDEDAERAFYEALTERRNDEAD